MASDIKGFISYLRDVGKTSKNTEISYQRDLMQLKPFLEDKGITEVEKAIKASLNSYILSLEKEEKVMTIIFRELASMKAFFNFMLRERRIRKDSVGLLKTPKIRKKASVVLSVNEANTLLDQPGTTTSKEVQDKAMLELLYTVGIRISELTGLEFSDLNTQAGYTTCRGGQEEHVVPFRRPAKQVLSVYLEKGRSQLPKDKEPQWLFTNRSGETVSHQGFWEIIERYRKRVDVQAGITPHTLRHSSAAYLIRSGADIHTVQAVPGRFDSTTIHMYAAHSNSVMKETYRAALLRE